MTVDDLETSEEDDNSPEKTSYMNTHTKFRSHYVRSARHMSSWNTKVHDRFGTMMARLKGHKQKLREH